jgi:hypothetical protein
VPTASLLQKDFQGALGWQLAAGSEAAHPKAAEWPTWCLFQTAVIMNPPACPWDHWIIRDAFFFFFRNTPLSPRIVLTCMACRQKFDLTLWVFMGID